jgi:hypothetical protein
VIRKRYPNPFCYVVVFGFWAILAMPRFAAQQTKFHEWWGTQPTTPMPPTFPNHPNKCTQDNHAEQRLGKHAMPLPRNRPLPEVRVRKDTLWFTLTLYISPSCSLASCAVCGVRRIFGDNMDPRFALSHSWIYCNFWTPRDVLLAKGNKWPPRPAEYKGMLYV